MAEDRSRGHLPEFSMHQLKPVVHQPLPAAASDTSYPPQPPPAPFSHGPGRPPAQAPVQEPVQQAPVTKSSLEHFRAPKKSGKWMTVEEIMNADDDAEFEETDEQKHAYDEVDHHHHHHH